MIACAYRVRGRLCANAAAYRVTTLADSFLVCAEHVAPYRARPNVDIERLP